MKLLDAFVARARAPATLARGSGAGASPPEGFPGVERRVVVRMRVRNVSGERIEFGGLLDLMLYARGSPAAVFNEMTEQRPSVLRGHLYAERLPSAYERFGEEDVLRDGETLSGAAAWAVQARKDSPLSLATIQTGCTASPAASAPGHSGGYPH